MNEISPAEFNTSDAQSVADPSLLGFLARAVHDPSIDVHKLEAIYRIMGEERREQRAILADDARVAFARAMNAVQAEIQAVARNAFNPETKSKYATLEAVDLAIRPVYTAHGFSLSFTETPNESLELRITCIVKHAAGHAEPFSLAALSDMTGPKGTPNKTHVQGIGSSTSYLRRYLTCMIFNVALRDDNDGNRTRPASPTEPSDEAKVECLVQLLRDTQSNERRFLDHMGFKDLRTVRDVPPGHFIRLKNALLTKKGILAQRAARAAAATQQGEPA